MPWQDIGTLPRQYYSLQDSMSWVPVLNKIDEYVIDE
jgi:hypothetical protein